jgi:hypothetical protein
MVGVYSAKISRIWFVARRDDPALPPSADSDRLPARLRIIVLFNRCVECIHVDMYDFAPRTRLGLSAFHALFDPHVRPPCRSLAGEDAFA